MHIPDGFIDLPTALGAAAVATAGVGVALRRAERDLGRRAVPLAGLLSAFVFAAQMLNLPVAAGTSAHLLGAGLAAVLLGPWLATVSMTVVLVAQALLFADGGIVALGLNLVNMAVIAPWLAWGAFRLTRAALPPSDATIAPAAFLAGLVSVLGAAGAFVGEYALGGIGGAPTALVGGAMMAVHLVIGVGEGVVTALLVGTVRALRPDLMASRRVAAPARAVGRRAPVAGGVALLSLALAALAGPFASSLPDGLERVAMDHGLASSTAVTPTAALAGYQFPDFAFGALGASLAGVLGVLLLLGASAALREVLRRSGHRRGGNGR
jgi:cobalt/nickel transport system permease protein